MARYTSPAPVILRGKSGVDYCVSTLDQVDQNLRTCNVPADLDLLLERRCILMLERDFAHGASSPS